MDVSRRISVLASVLLVGLLLAPAVADAADAVERVTTLNKKALDLYKKRDYDTARALLKEALEVCNTSGLDNHPIKARTHIHLGMVAMGGFKERDLAIKHFRKALELQPDIKLTKAFATKDIQDAFEEAALVAGGGEGGGGPAGDGKHADEAGGGPAEGGDHPPAAQTSEDDEGKPKPRARAKKKSSDDENDDAGEEEEDEGKPFYRIYMAASFGSGAGIASGKGELDPNAHVLMSSGFALAQAGHVTPEIGFFITKNFMLSVRLRLQYVTGVTGKMAPTGCGTDMFCTPSNLGVAGFGRGSIFFGGSFVRMYVAAEAGGGNIRHVQSFPNDKMCGKTGALTSCVDSFASGPVFVGGAFGIVVDFSRVVAFTASVALDLGFPNFTANFDLNPIGLAFHF